MSKELVAALRAMHLPEADTAADRIERFQSRMSRSYSLDQLILELEQDANFRAYQAKHGSSVSSISEDICEGKIATVIRDIIDKLKKVDSLRGLKQ